MKHANLLVRNNERAFCKREDSCFKEEGNSCLNVLRRAHHCMHSLLRVRYDPLKLRSQQTGNR
jgi:hypothetical protein